MIKVKKFYNLFLNNRFVFDKPGETPRAAESETRVEKKTPDLKEKTEIKAERADLADKKAQETTEKPVENETPAGKIHKTYFEKTEAIKEEDAEKDRTTLRDNDIKTIRFKSRLLKPKAEKEDEMTQALSIKEETARRIKAYTDKGTNDWYTLNYQRLGSDKKGHTHEMNVGLGDILLDPSIKNLLVKKADGSIIKAHRGIVPSRQMHAGRLAFMDENNTYIGTFTGDSFRILSDEEADLTNPEARKKYLKEFSDEEKAREEDEKHFDDEMKSQEDQDVYYTEANLDPNKSVVEQIKIPLNASQKENAQIIEKIFKEKLQGKGLTDEAIAKITAAAIVNAYKESGLNAKSVGDHGNSIGLFQLNVNGGGHGMSIEERQDPTTNTTTIIDREVLGSFGRVLIARAKAGATVTELAAIFSKYIERPRDVYGAMQARSKTALKMFGERVVNTQDEIAERIDNGKEGANGKGIIKLRSNQDAWIFGSSSAVGLNSSKDKLGLQNVGFFGIVGINSGNFYKKLVENWDRIKTLKFPPQVILMGMAANGLNNSDSSVRENLENYSKIKTLLESRGTKVTVTTVQPSEKNGEGVKKFNDELRRIYGENCIDVAQYTTTSDGTEIISEYAAQYGHLKGEGAKILDRMVIKAVKDGAKSNDQAINNNEEISEKIKNGIINLRSNQDSWILGSSTAVQMNGIRDTLSLGNTGFFGIGGSGPDGFYQKLQDNWPRISQLKLPKQIVIAGLAVNGLSSATNSVEKNLSTYEKIRKFLSEKGVKVRIATIQPAVGKGEVTREFNDELRKKYGSDVLIDISKYTVAEDGTKLKPEFANSDGIHLSKKGYQAFAKMINESANGNS
ncbi:MAG: hypothetical protein NTZ25_04070 [Candidatus Peregrinibacteria bacterium]|nr:hypothetical protein [Candidatus Peregrinibacteria bacterium]